MNSLSTLDHLQSAHYLEMAEMATHVLMWSQDPMVESSCQDLVKLSLLLCNAMLAGITSCSYQVKSGPAVSTITDQSFYVMFTILTVSPITIPCIMMQQCQEGAGHSTVDWLWWCLLLAAPVAYNGFHLSRLIQLAAPHSSTCSHHGLLMKG